MPEPYSSLKTVYFFDEHGWFSNEKELEACFDEKNIHTVVEVGCWLGLSTRYLGTKVTPSGKVYAVDTWLGSPDEPVHLEDPRLPDLYERFLSNVIYEGLTNVIVPIRMDSLEAAKTLDVKADLIYIDASHNTEAVYHDILQWHRHLNPDGIICGDDFCWGTVAEGVKRAAAELDLQIESGHTWWRLR